MKKCFQKLHKNNSGVSLVELMIVLAIMSVLAGVMAYSFSIVSTKNATQCAKNMQLAIEKHRTNVMGKKNGSITFSYESDGVYVVENFDGNNLSPVRIGKPDVVVKYSNGTEELTSGNSFTVSFNRSDGSVKCGYDKFPITVSKKSKVYTLTIDELTGRLTLQ